MDAVMKLRVSSFLSHTRPHTHTHTHTRGGRRGTAALPVTVCHIYKAFIESAKAHKDTRALKPSHIQALNLSLPVPPSHTWPATRCIFRCTGSGSDLPAPSVDVTANNMSNNSTS